MRLIILLFASSLFLASCATRVVIPASNVTVIKTAPKHYKTVSVKGKRYYHWNGKHYRRTKKGYVVVRI